MNPDVFGHGRIQRAPGDHRLQSGLPKRVQDVRKPLTRLRKGLGDPVRVAIKTELTLWRFALNLARPWFSMVLANPQPKREIMRASFVCRVFL